VTRSPRPSPSIFAYCKRSNTGGGNSLGTRLEIDIPMYTYTTWNRKRAMHIYITY